ncbi:unnamed protein product [Caenorhabditis angaria]|uniref:DUF4783 domain-containing protein n=1 Tax=Caenorhabditis angaria TaxID=860376 RepID=A0A9P1IV25_9PELO|nr:unnamed protein product [Caenorhabditis angaria]
MLAFFILLILFFCNSIRSSETPIQIQNVNATFSQKVSPEVSNLIKNLIKKENLDNIFENDFVFVKCGIRRNSSYFLENVIFKNQMSLENIWEYDFGEDLTLVDGKFMTNVVQIKIGAGRLSIFARYQNSERNLKLRYVKQPCLEI